MNVSELLTESRRYSWDHSDFKEIKNEIERRLAEKQMEALVAQIKAAWWQVAAVVAMYLTIIATLATPWIAHLFLK
jgi:hypothetical protein